MLSHSPQSGFTLVEMLVSLALFTIVSTIATGTLLVLIRSNSDTVDEQLVMTSLNFAMDSMTREIRTGSRYFCDNAVDVVRTSSGHPLNGTDGAFMVQDCPSGAVGVSFREGGNSVSGNEVHQRIAYYYDAPNQTIMRQVGDNSPQSILSDDVRVTQMRFVVLNTDPLERESTLIGQHNIHQPTVTIAIIAEADTADGVVPLALHTTVTQRALDL